MSLSTSVVVACVLSTSTAVKRKREDEIPRDKPMPMAMLKENDEQPPPPSWEVLNAISYYMDPETLAVASCVSTTWLKCFSSENLWKTIMTARSSQRSCPYEIALEHTEGGIISYKRLVSAVERDAKRRRKGQPEEAVKISLSDLSFIIHVSTRTKKASVYKKGKDLVFGPNDKFQIEVDVSKAGITAGEDDVRVTWQIMYKEKFFTVADTARSLDMKYGWFVDKLEYKDNRKLVGDVKTTFKEDVLEKIGFAIVDSDGWGSLLVDGFLSSQIFRQSNHMNQIDSDVDSNGRNQKIKRQTNHSEIGAGKGKEPRVISPGGSKTEEKQSQGVTNQIDKGQDGRQQPHGEVNMEASISEEDVIRAGGFGAKDDIGSFLPVASDSTDFEESLRSARDYEEAQEEVQRPGLGWPKE
uniref:F-box domain-containing protein n=1 Tax=Brassica oleracea var. oleracea TaxID=109376 RepID=A0A0D3EI08_BRAOL